MMINVDDFQIGMTQSKSLELDNTSVEPSAWS